MKDVMIGMGQILVEGGNIEQNIERAVSMIEESARKGCKIVVLPECLDIGWTYPDAPILARPIPGRYSKQLCRAAKNNRIYVVAGLTEKCNDFIYNSAILISPEGKILLKHRKINELEIAQHLYTTGDSLSVVKTPYGVIGVNICADNFPDAFVLGHSLARMGAELILSPCSWAVKQGHNNEKEPYGRIWKESYRELARLYDMCVIGVSNVGYIERGVWEGRRCIGCSLAVGHGGKILVQGPYGTNAEELITLSVEVIERKVTGTAISAILEQRGYRK
jgi:predicted amidohydrolase